MSMIRKYAVRAAIAGIAGLVARRGVKATRSGRAAAFGERAARDTNLDDAAPVRPAGAETMRDPPNRWDAQDEASDESFPASDAAAKY